MKKLILLILLFAFKIQAQTNYPGNQKFNVSGTFLSQTNPGNGAVYKYLVSKLPSPLPNGTTTSDFEIYTMEDNKFRFAWHWTTLKDVDPLFNTNYSNFYDPFEEARYLYHEDNSYDYFQHSYAPTNAAKNNDIQKIANPTADQYLENGPAREISGKAVSIEFKASLKIDPSKISASKSTSNGSLIPYNSIEGDAGRSVFGFKEINEDGSLNCSNNNSNFDLSITPKSTYTNTFIKVISDNFPNNEYRLAYGDDDHKISRGAYCLIAIKLKRKTVVDVAENGKQVFKIKIKSEFPNQKPIVAPATPYFIFNEVPEPNAVPGQVINKIKSDEEEIAEGIAINSSQMDRGKRINQSTYLGPNNKDEFIITDNMLPIDGTYVTIYAAFTTANLGTGVRGSDKNSALLTSYYFDNHNVMQFKYEGLNKFTNLQIEGYYKNSEQNTAIDIDFIRLENQEGKKLFWGEYDPRLYHAGQLFAKMSKSNQMYTLENNQITEGTYPRHLKRLYLQDEGGVNYFKSYKYVYDLIGNICHVERGTDYANEGNYYIGNQNSWTITGGLLLGVSSPYFKTYKYIDWNSDGTMNNEQEMADRMYYERGFYHGVNVATNESKIDGMRKGAYEISSYNNINITNFNQFNSSYSSLTFGEFNNTNPGTFGLFYDKKMNGMIYNRNDSWIGQINFDQVFNFDPQFNLTIGTPVMVLTGEHTNSFLFYNLIFGAKGLSADGIASFPFVQILGKPSGTYGARIRLFNQGGITQADANTVNSLINSTEPDIQKQKIDFLLKEEFGSDFLANDISDIDHLNLQSLNIQDKIKWSVISKSLDVDINRIYIGQKSMRLGLFQAYNFAKKNESTLLKLEFQAAYGKGYLTYNTQDPAIQTPNYLNTIINVNEITTRPLVWDNIKNVPKGRTNLNGTEYWENTDKVNLNDSSFFDVTLMHNKLKDKKEEFYISVFNKRSNPLFYDSSKGNNNPDAFTFLTYAEWYEMYNFPSRRPLNWTLDSLKKYWWGRAGSREIKVPFQFNSFGSTANQYKLLKITELDAEFKDNNNNLIANSDLPMNLQNGFVDKIDTVIGQDGILMCKLHPGEGKILKVQVLDPGMLNGNLANSNQTKLVCFPYYEPGTNNITDKVEYHTVFHKRAGNGFINPISGLEDQEDQVFYCKSYPMSKNSNNSNILWREPIQISKFDQIDINNIDGDHTKFSTESDRPYKADFPSLIVKRFTSPNMTCAVIMYQSFYKDPTNPNLESQIGYINEAVFNDYVPLQNYVRKKFFKGNIDHKDIGNPVICSTPNGFFEAWTSKKDLATTDYYLNYTYRHNFNIKFDFQIKQIDNTSTSNVNLPNFTDPIKLHPSLNSYSDETDEAVLVWEETDMSDNFPSLPSQSKKKIYFTFLNQLGNIASHFLAPINASNAFKNGISLKDNGKIGKIVWGGTYGEFPVVNLVEKKNPNGDITKKISMSWQRNWNNGAKDNFLITFFYSKDSFFPNGIIDITNNSVIRNCNQGFEPTGPELPNLSYCPSPFTNTNSKNRFTHYDCISNANIYSTILERFAPFNSNITNPVTQYLPLSSYFSKIAIGDFNHLAQIHPSYLDNPNTMWKNRRIFESGNYIQSDANKFYKIGNSDEDMEFYLKYSNLGTSYGITNPQIDGVPMGIAINGETLDSTLGVVKIKNTDSLFTNWFLVPNTVNLKFKANGTFKKGMNNDTTLYIQKQSDMSLIPIAINKVTGDNFATLVNYTLVNGLNDNYRIVMTRRDSSYVISDTKIFGSLSTSDTLNYKQNDGNGIKIIDLASKTTQSFDNESILIYPNPTNGIVNISPAFMEDNKLQNTNVIITISNITGATIYNTKARNGSQISFDTSNLTIGSYIVTCETEHDEFKQARTLTSKFTVTK